LFPISWKICECIAAAYLRLFDQSESSASGTQNAVQKSAKERRAEISYPPVFGIDRTNSRFLKIESAEPLKILKTRPGSLPGLEQCKI